MKKKQYNNKAKKIKKQKKGKKIIHSKSVKLNKNLVNKKMSFGEIMNRYPEAAEVLMNKGMHCIGCGMAMYETLEQGAIMHGLNPDKLVEEINSTVSFRKRNSRKVEN